jgi:phenylacetate-CoA oxygenase PaaI subunit
MEFMKDREAAIDETPAAAEPQGSVDAFSPETQNAILAILVTLADNKYKLGRRYSEWATSAPTLEASVAAASMTSDEVGHARSLYPLLKKFPGAPAGLKKEDDRTEFHNVSFLDEPFLNWTDFIAAAAIFDKALTLLVEALRDSAYTPFQHRSRKILQEEHYHTLYADGWLETLSEREATREPLRASMNRIWEETLAWFGPEDDPVFRIATEEKIVAADGTALRRRFLDEVRRTVEPLAGVGFPDDAPIPWDRWDAPNRRLGPR